jgi:hypothetical protein
LYFSYPNSATYSLSGFCSVFPNFRFDYVPNGVRVLFVSLFRVRAHLYATLRSHAHNIAALVTPWLAFLVYAYRCLNHDQCGTGASSVREQAMGVVLAATAALAVSVVYGTVMKKRYFRPHRFDASTLELFEESVAAVAAAAAAPACADSGTSAAVAVAVAVAERSERWWEQPADLTEEELGVLRYFSSITWQVGEEEMQQIFNMTGSGGQLGFTAIRCGRRRVRMSDSRLHSWLACGRRACRYHLAFLTYAVATTSMRTPAYQGLMRRITLRTMDQILQPRVWCYMTVSGRIELAAHSMRLPDSAVCELPPTRFSPPQHSSLLAPDLGSAHSATGRATSSCRGTARRT